MVLFVFIVLFLVIIMDKFYKCEIRLNKKFCIKVFFFLFKNYFVFELYMCISMFLYFDGECFVRSLVRGKFF